MDGARYTIPSRNRLQTKLGGLGGTGRVDWAFAKHAWIGALADLFPRVRV